MGERPSLDLHQPISALGLVRAERGDVRVEKLQLRLKPKVPFPHKHDFFQVVYITEGSGWHQIDFSKYKVRRDQLFLVKPGEVHIWKMSPKTKGYVLEFTDESLSRESSWVNSHLEQVSSLPHAVHLRGGASSKIKSLLQSMLEEYEQRDHGFDVVLQSHLKALLIQWIRLCPEIQWQRKEDPSVSRKFRALIEDHFKKQHTVEFYAKALGLNAKALTMRMARTTGKSAREMIQERILTEAKRLLLFTRISISEVGYELGFSDPNYFVRFFRSHVNKSPLKFRQESLSERS